MGTKNRAILKTEKSETGNRKPESQSADPATARVRVRATQAFREYTGHERAEDEVFETALETAKGLGALVEILPE